MNNKTIFVTGANRGIGLELCKWALKKDCNVIAACRVASKELSSLPLSVVEGFDVTDDEAIKKVVDSIPTIDVLINNAGILSVESIDKMDWAKIESQFTINAMGALRCTTALLDKINRPGKVVLVTSRMGSIADNSSGGYYGYRMSKAALNAAGKSLAIDLKPKDISVLIVHPGFVKTDMTNFNGVIEPTQSAEQIFQQIDALNSDTTGAFRHANGESLPW